MDGMNMHGDDDVTELESSPDSDQPILVTSVDYCLMCGQIAVLYDLEGKVMKREMVDVGLDVTFHELFDYLCHSLGVRKNSRLKKDWDFFSGPFPFCVECEQLMHSLAAIYRQKGELKNSIKSRMYEAEDKFVREALYDQQDYRYSDFRKHALGDFFKGDKSATRRRASQRLSKIKIDSTSSASAPEVKLEEENPPPVIQVETKPEDCKNNDSSPVPIDVQPTATPKEELEELPMPNTSTSTVVPAPTRRSLRIRNKDIKNEFRAPVLNNELEVYTVTENFETGTSSNPVIVEAENLYGNEGSRHHHHTRGRKRKRQSDAVPLVQRDNDNGESLERETFGNKPFKKVKPEYNDDNDWNWEEDDSRKKRKKIKGKKNQTVKKNSKTVKHENEADLDFRPRRKYERRIKIEVDDNDEKVEYADAESLYKIVPLIKDPLSGNVYYRNLLFVWIKEEKAFQCSTCSFFIPNNVDSTLKNKFYRHYLLNHSDRFKCRICPDSNIFQNDMELHQHFRHCHPGFLHIEPQIKSSRSRESKMSLSSHPPPIAVVVGEPRKHCNIKQKPCTICLKPLNPKDEQAIEEHRLSHMNADEQATYLKSEAIFYSRPRKGPKNEVKNQDLYFPSFISSPSSTNMAKFSKSRSCPICCKSGISSTAYNDHRISHMNREEKKSFLKAHGGKGTKGKRGRKKLNKIEEVNQDNLSYKPKPTSEHSQFTCTHCGWKTVNEEYYQVHMKRHEDVKFNAGSVIFCKYPKCEMTFQLADKLKNHVENVHKGNASQYMCKLCGRVFSNLQRLNSHEIVHKEESKYQCQICHKGFSHNFVLKDHLSQVHGDGQTLTCTEDGCGAEFKAKNSLQSHLRRVHGILMKNDDLSTEKKVSTDVINVPMKGNRRKIGAHQF